MLFSISFKDHVYRRRLTSSQRILRITSLSVNCFAGVRTTRRQKRQTSFRLYSFYSCLEFESQDQDPLKYVKASGCILSTYWDLVCKVKDLNRNVFFYVTCREKKFWPTAYVEWSCSTKHLTALNVQCCDYRCPIPVN